MALLDRIKERVETDLSDEELQAMIDGAVEEIERRFGPNAEITVQHEGGESLLRLGRPLDAAAEATVVEIEPRSQGGAASETTLAADDYRILFGGRILERLIDGTNGRGAWAPFVMVTYTPLSDAKQREEVVIKIVQLDVQYRGLSGERAGDWQAQFPDAAVEREKLINSLAPRCGLSMA